MPFISFEARGHFRQSVCVVCREPFRLVSNYATRRPSQKWSHNQFAHSLLASLSSYSNRPRRVDRGLKMKPAAIGSFSRQRNAQSNKRVECEKIRKLKIQIDRTVSSSCSSSYLSYIGCLQTCAARITSQDVVDFGSRCGSKRSPAAAPDPAYTSTSVRALWAGCPAAASLWTASGSGGHLGVHCPTL